MKDAKGHGSDPRGAHAEGVDQIGRPAPMYRGVKAGVSAQDALRPTTVGDLGPGIYLSPSLEIASSYGGGPGSARTVHSYDFNRELALYEIANVFGGAKIGSDVSIVRGDGQKIYEGPWGAKQMDAALKNSPEIKAVIGDKNSIGINQIAIRDPSVLVHRESLDKKAQPALAGRSLGRRK